MARQERPSPVLGRTGRSLIWSPDLYVSEQVDKVHLIYNHFKSPLEQKVMDVTLLPIAHEDVSLLPMGAARW